MESDKRAPRHNYQRRNENRRYNFKSGDVPAWEKRFCLVVGRMRWKDFLRSKECVDSFGESCFYNIVNWDDSAAVDCFRSAKARFFAENYSSGGGSYDLPPLPSPDGLIDEVVWRDSATEEERRLVAEIEEAQEAAWRLAAVKAAEEEEEKLRSLIPLEEIVATGWDDEGCDSWQDPTLTGMIIGGGGDDCDREGFKGGRNYEDDGAENRNWGKLAAAAAVNGGNADRGQVYWRRIPTNVGF